MYNPFTLAGKAILVTGASSGIGAAVAVECSKLGAQVILTARNEQRLQSVMSQLDGDEHKIISADIACNEGLERVADECPKIDGMVFCAGISAMTPISFVSAEKIEPILNVNTISPIVLTKLLLKKKKIQTGASLVYIASISGLSNFAPGVSMYGVSKSGLTAFVKYAAVELASKKIRCNAIHPGRINTPFIAGGTMSEEDVQRDIATYPLKRYGQPKEVAHAAAYLLSDAACWMTGSDLVIDGGRSLV